MLRRAANPVQEWKMIIAAQQFPWGSAPFRSAGYPRSDITRLYERNASVIKAGHIACSAPVNVTEKT
jgi:hypothetical protein